MNEIQSQSGIQLQNMIAKLDELAPLRYAESWDNVGLLIEPYTPKTIQTVFLTNDLTETVVKEALEVNADLIISYHPPIFAPLKKITQSNWKERILSLCIEKRIAVYSPHTSWDSCRNGVNDWLASSLPYETSEPIEKHPDGDFGMGRILNLPPGINFSRIVDSVKELTKLKNVHVAIGNGFTFNSEVKTVAICAGSGASLLRKVQADVYISGEMSHHEILNATQNNISVILCNHSNSERGYLKQFKTILEKNLDNKIIVIVSKTDNDPLTTI